MEVGMDFVPTVALGNNIDWQVPKPVFDLFTKQKLIVSGKNGRGVDHEFSTGSRP